MWSRGSFWFFPSTKLSPTDVLQRFRAKLSPLRRTIFFPPGVSPPLVEETSLRDPKNPAPPPSIFPSG